METQAAMAEVPDGAPKPGPLLEGDGVLESEPEPVRWALVEAQGTHFTPATDPGLLADQIVLWEGLVASYPESVKAKEQLAFFYGLKGQQTGEISWTKAELLLVTQLAQEQLARGRVTFTDRLRLALVRLGDEARARATFAPLVAASGVTARERYLATVDMAQTLWELGAKEDAFALFERAIAERPEACEEAVIRYATALIAAQRPQRALELVEGYAPEDRLVLPPLAYLRLEARRKLGLDTGEAEKEVQRVRELLNSFVVGGGLQRPAGLEVRATFAHSVAQDDCRQQDYHWLWIDPWGSFFYTYAVNFAEVLYNEARGEPWSAIAAVAWTVRNRALGRLSGVWTASGQWAGISCDSYPGGWYSHGNCATLPPGDYQQQYWDLSRWYCCALHGGTLSVGATTWQFNDTHYPWDDLKWTALQYMVWYVLNGVMPDMSQPRSGGEEIGWVPYGVSGCFVNCVGQLPPNDWRRRLPGCLDGSNVFHFNANGAFEFRNHPYQAGNAANCKQERGQVCGSVNYFWNRLNHLPVGKTDPFWDYTNITGCAADPDAPWEIVNVSVWVEDPPNSGSWQWVGFGVASQDYGGPCQINGQNFGRYRKFQLQLPRKYRTGSWRFKFRVPDVDEGREATEWVSVR
ncbi:MAG: tetratricopeptide repeat protein [Thermoanaerobaculum sp.]